MQKKNALDYFSGGMAMPNRSLTGSEQYRYGYQGEFAEKDPETGHNAFQLRMYDSRINRWISPDPYGQYDSPYLAMGNRPNMLVDPDGGCVDENGNPCATPGEIGGTAFDGGGNQWSWDGETWNTDFAFGLNEVMVSGQGNGLNGVASVRFEQYNLFIQPDITQRKAEWKGAYAMALSPFAAIGIVEGLAALPSVISNITAASTTEATSVAFTQMGRHGAQRLVARTATGQFTSGTGKILTQSMIHQLNGLNSLGQATALTPLVAQTVAKIPVWVRWLIVGGGTAAVLNREKEIHKKEVTKK